MWVSIFIASKSHTSPPWLINKFIFAPSLCFVQPQHPFHVVYNDWGHEGEIPSLWAAPSSHITQIKDMQSATGGFTPSVLLLDLWCRRDESYWPRDRFKTAPSIRALESGDCACLCARMYATEAGNESRSRGGEWMDHFNLEGGSHYSPPPYRHVVAALLISLFVFTPGYSFSFSWPGLDTLRRESIYIQSQTDGR